MIRTYPNPQLAVVDDNKGNWNLPENRRKGFHSLHEIARYTTTFRASNVMKLERRAALPIAELDCVRHLTAKPWFSAMAVAHGQHLLFERYAPDFGPEKMHSIQSISKLLVHLIFGQLYEAGLVDLDAPVSRYLPEVASGYAQARLQDVLNMNVFNDYSEDYSDPDAAYYVHEEAMGWRLPRDPENELTLQGFIATIESPDPVNRTGMVHYKDSNSEILGWIAERVSGRRLRDFIADIVDAAGIEGRFAMCTDRTGFPVIDGGGCLTLRDLIRYGSIFAREGMGINGKRVGSAAFMEKTVREGTGWSRPDDVYRYSNQSETDGKWIGHGGYCGQYLMIHRETGLVCAHLSVSEDKDGICDEHFADIWNTMDAVATLMAPRLNKA